MRRLLIFSAAILFSFIANSEEGTLNFKSDDVFSVMPSATGSFSKSQDSITVELENFTLTAKNKYKDTQYILGYSVGIAFENPEGHWDISGRSEYIENKIVMIPGQTFVIGNFKTKIPINGVGSLNKSWLVIIVKSKSGSSVGFTYAHSQKNIFAHKDSPAVTNSNSNENNKQENAYITVFGIPLGKPILLKECDFRLFPPDQNSHSEYFRYPLNSERDRVCFEYSERENRGKRILPKDQPISIKWPENRNPKMAVFERMQAEIIDGNIEAFFINTGGVKTQESDYKSLVDKFGKPTTFKRIELNNSLGDTTTAYQAEWHTPQVHVLFGLGNEDAARKTNRPYDRGLVIIQTEKSYLLHRDPDYLRPTL